jgi:simple sugar transport system substrate-binding protein
MNGSRRVAAIGSGAILAAGLLAALPIATSAQDDQKEFYVVTHGTPSDPYWILVNDAAVQAGDDLGVKVNVSFANNDVAVQKENFNAAIAAGADGIAASSPEIGALVDETQAALAAGIPVVFLDTDDKQTGRLAYVGADLGILGTTWANWLVDNAGLTEGSHVWMPVEAAGAAYQVMETEAIASVFDPLGITYDVFEAGGDPATALANMTDYLTAHSGDIDAIIGLGDLVMATIRPAFDASGVAAGSIPVVGWGGTGETAHEVKDGYVNYAVWGYPDASGYDSVILLNKAAEGLSIGYDVPTQTFYDASTADKYIELTSQ